MILFRRHEVRYMKRRDQCCKIINEGLKNPIEVGYSKEAMDRRQTDAAAALAVVRMDSTGDFFLASPDLYPDLQYEWTNPPSTLPKV